MPIIRLSEKCKALPKNNNGQIEMRAPVIIFEREVKIYPQNPTTLSNSYSLLLTLSLKKQE